MLARALSALVCKVVSDSFVGIARTGGAIMQEEMTMLTECRVGSKLDV